jgi:hypothetical protein
MATPELPLRSVRLETPLGVREVRRRLAEATAGEGPFLKGEVEGDGFRVGLPVRARRRGGIVLAGTFTPAASGTRLEGQVRFDRSGLARLLLSVVAAAALVFFFYSQGVPLAPALMPLLLIVANLLSAYTSSLRLERAVDRLLR